MDNGWKKRIHLLLVGCTQPATGMGSRSAERKILGGSTGISSVDRIVGDFGLTAEVDDQLRVPKTATLTYLPQGRRGTGKGIHRSTQPANDSRYAQAGRPGHQMMSKSLPPTRSKPRTLSLWGPWARQANPAPA